MTAALLGVFGALIGSFLALVSARWPKGEDIVFARSRCPACRAPLGPLELAPLVSFAALRGRCRRCRAPIHWRYPAIEFVCVIVGVWAGLAVADPAQAVLTAALGWALVLIAVLDAEHFWLPDALTAPLLLAGLAQAWALAPETLAARAIGAASGFASLAALAFAYKRLRGRDGLGDGDPRLFAAAGAWVGWAGLPSVLVWASASALSFVLARALTRGGVRGDDPLPLGSHLALGLWLTWMLGPLGVSR